MDELDFLKQPDVRAFIIENEHADIPKLLLNPPGAYADKIKLIADQIISRRKLKNKLPKWVESEVILPPPVSAEQSSSQETADYKASFYHGDHLIDLTGGQGVDTIALSSNFNKVTYVEPDPWLCKLFSYNKDVLGREKIDVSESTAEYFLDQFNGSASYYIDPGRRLEKRKVFKLEDCAPNLMELLPILKNKGDSVLLKLSPMMDIKEGIRKLSYVRSVHVVSVKNECKELLFHLEFPGRTENPSIICVNLKHEPHEVFEFSYKEERSAKAGYSIPKKFLYDPNASILKAGAFNLAGKRAGLFKISPNTHLYTSDQLNNKFPGRCFEVIGGQLKSVEIKKTLSGSTVHVVTKNYPQSSDALKKKYGLKDGGEKYLIGLRDKTDTAGLFLCQRIY